jgi:DNA-binding NtrC family response regulator
MENKGTILYADDDEDVRTSVKDILEEEFPNYNLEFFVGGTSLENKLKSLLQKPENTRVVITENDMPGINGGEIIEKYAEKFKFRFGLFYGGGIDVGEKAIKDGAFGCLRKPIFDINKLVDFVQKGLDSYKE